MEIEGGGLVRKRSIEIEIGIPQIGTILKIPHPSKANGLDHGIEPQELTKCLGEVKVFKLMRAFDGLYVLAEYDKCKFETMEEF